MRKKECQRQKINLASFSRLLRKEEGSTEWVVGMFFLLLLAILLCMQLELSLYDTAGACLEDALAASNLASAVVDLDEYGISHTVRIPDLERAYARFEQAVKGNLGLDDAWESSGFGVVGGPVRILDYIVYNVEPDKVAIWEIREDGSVHTGQGSPGSVRAPNGQMVENTSVYSEITFPVKGLFGMEVQARKSKLVDVLAEARE